MALSRKFLAALGIEADKIDQIIEAHSETVEALKADRDSFKERADKYEEVQKELDSLKEESEKNKGKDDDYAKLKKEFDDYKADVETKAVRSKKEEAYKEILKDAGIPEKHFAKILKYSDIDGVELDKDGKITTSKDLLKSIKEEWSDHITTDGKQGADTATPPGGDDNSGVDTSYAAQRAARYHANLYGGSTKEEK